MDKMNETPLTEPEVYNLKHWRGLRDRSRGSKNAPAFKYKLEFCRYIDKAPRLSDATKRPNSLDWRP